MQMTISTTGRRQLCILCSVCVLSKMLKLCGVEGSSFRWLMGAGSCFCWDLSNFALKWISVLSRILFVGGTPDRSVLMLLSGFDWCIQWLRSIWVSRWIMILNWHIGYCQPFVVEAASVQQLGVRSLDAVNFLLVDQRPGVFIRLIDCWGPSDFVSEVDLSSMLSVLRWGLSNGELAVARTIWRVSVVGGVRSLFWLLTALVEFHQLLDCWGGFLCWAVF